MNITKADKKINKNSIDMTKGPLIKNMLTMAIPIALTTLLQFLYHSADLAVVGQFADNPEISLSAIGATGPITALFINLFLGVSLGANIIVAQNIGAKNSQNVHDSVHTAIMLSIIVGLFCGILGFFLSGSILKLMNCSGQIYDFASKYLKIIFIGMPFNLVYNFGSSILRANGDTKRPFIILTIAGILNVFLNLFFVIVFHLDVLGVALATIMSQLFSAIVIIILLINNTDDTKLNLKELRIHKQRLREILSVGLPAGIESSSFNIPNIIARTYLLELGDVISSASTIQWDICNYVMSISMAIKQTTVAFVAQNYGAKQIDYIKTIYQKALLLGEIITVAICVILTVFRYPLFLLFTDSKEIIKYANIGLLISMPFYLFWMLSEASLGASKGLGNKRGTTIIHFSANCVFRVLYFIFIFPINKSFILLTLVYPASWTISGILQYVWFKIYYKKIKKEVKENLG